MEVNLRGIDVAISFNLGGGFLNWSCATDFSVEFTAELKSVKTVGNGKWAVPKGQALSYQVNINGLVQLDEFNPTSFVALNYMTGHVEIPFKIIFTDPATMAIRVITGSGLISSLSLGASAQGGALASNSLTIAGSGEPLIADSLTPCNPEITDTTYTITPRDSAYRLTIGISVTQFTFRVDYSLDGGSTFSWFPGIVSHIIIDGITVGSHSVSLTPVCESGDSGETITHSFSAP